MLSLSLYTMLKLPKTSSPQKLLGYDCVTLYKHYALLRVDLPNIVAFTQLDLSKACD